MMDRKELVVVAPHLAAPCLAGRFVASSDLIKITDLAQTGIASGVYTAAACQELYDPAGLSWCGTGCGKCYQLTSTGSAPCQTCGEGGASGQSIIVMVTNLCPNNGNAQWCPTPGGKNQYGYQYHFDIMAQSEVLGDNPVVNFEEVTCPSAATSDYSQCQCAA